MLAPNLAVLMALKYNLLRALRNAPLNHHGRPHSLTPAKAPKATLPEYFRPVLVRIHSKSATEGAIGGHRPRTSFPVKVHAAIHLDTRLDCCRSPTIPMPQVLTFLLHMSIQQ